ncbi:MAG TPA: DNA repair protein RecO [Aliidiomarina sp.]|nr:DNA repair protein RecO [Aliidiomarina sp.]
MTSAFILHRWPYQEHSFLLDLFTAEYGRKRVLARGVRGAKNKWRGALEPFNHIDVQWRGRGDLPTLQHADVVTCYPLQGHYLYSGFYANELLQRLLPEQYPAPELFSDYCNTLSLLSDKALLEPVLRRFEWQLLSRLDISFSWLEDAITGEPIHTDQCYVFYPEQGFVAVAMKPANAFVLQGRDILALADFKLDSEVRLKQYKQLMRAALQPHLGNKPLQSRNLFRMT